MERPDHPASTGACMRSRAKQAQVRNVEQEASMMKWSPYVATWVARHPGTVAPEDAEVF